MSVRDKTYAISCPACLEDVQFPMAHELYPVTLVPNPFVNQIPECLKADQSGVFATAKIHPGRMLGPVVGRRPLNGSHWTSLARSPMEREDLNCLVVTFEGQKYFLTIKPVEAGEELLVNFHRRHYRKLYERLRHYCTKQIFSCDFNHPIQPFYNWEKFYFLSCRGCDCLTLAMVENNKFTFIPDSPVPPGYPLAAHKSLPEGLIIGRSSIPSAGLGVFTTRLVPSETTYGPYKGVRGPHGHSKYLWNIRGETNVDGDDLKLSNWMRFVNCAPSLDELNLLPLFYHDDVYYTAPKEIPAGKELFTDYGKAYANSLGSSLHENTKEKRPCPFHFGENK